MRKILLYGIAIIFVFGGILYPSGVRGQATLKHSYTFEEGTYDETTVFDQKGSVNGVLGGTKISIADGKATVSGATSNSDGWISFDGVALALNTYSAVTLEAFVETGNALNTGYTMLAYFGTSSPGVGCFWIQPTRAANETRIEANNTSTTVSAIMPGYEVDDGKMHHIVAVLNNEALTYYLDGVIIAQTPTGADFISTLGTDVANLFRGVDGWNDPNYNASLLEFNIYNGTLEQYTIAQTAGEFLGLDLTNATLENLTVNVGAMLPDFDPETDIYEVTVPYGTTRMTITAKPVVGGVAITMFDGLGTELKDGVVTFDKDEGIDVEIEVKALDGYTTKSYYVSVFPDDGKSSATLGAINLSAGKLIETFMMDSTRYTVIVPPGTAAVTVTGVPNWDKATVTGNGTVTLVDGEGTAILSVTSEDGTATKEYVVNIYTSVVTTGTDFYLVHELNGFVAAESGAAFNQVILADAVYQDNMQIWQFEDSKVKDQYFIRNKAGNYMCLSRTSANAWDLEVYPDLPSVSLDSARFILNEFEPGRFRIISVRKQQASATNNMLGPNNGNLGSPLFNDKWRSTANDPLTVFNIKKPEEVVSPYDIHLSALTISGVILKPAFNPAYRNYYATIPVGMTSVQVDATPRDAAAVVTGTGNVGITPGKGTITVRVTASDPQYTRDYVVHYITDTELTLMHSYTFDDGTANDQVGDADGTVHGGSFADGTFIAAAEGDYIVLPAAKIALNTYPTFTMEAHVITGVNPAWTMYTYFGNTTGGDHTFFISLAGDNNLARGVLNLGDGEVQAASPEPGAGETHHYVCVITNDTLYWYVDGSLAQKTPNKPTYLIKDISNANAWFGYGAYTDPTWLGTTNEFNIYSGQMDAATVAARAKHFLGDMSTDATLSSLSVDAGELIPEFDPAVTSYSVLIPPGVTTINVSAVPNDDKSIVEGVGAVDVSLGSGQATVLVTAENGSKKSYTIAFNAPSEYTLMHSWTFDDGTAADVVGDADGTPVGNGTIANGAYTAIANGDFIELPADVIAINTYPAITLEGYIFADVDNTGPNMLAYFGGSENGYGSNGYFVTPDRNSASESRTAISCGNLTAPWSVEQGVTGPGVSVGAKHHIVSVLTNSSITLYIDGILIGTTPVSGDNSIAGISNAYAWLCKGGYTGDPTWMGTIDKFNIYSGVLDAATVAKHAQQYLAEFTLMHSYTFEDGTAKDVVGDADGTLVGGTIANGAYTAAANGEFIELPAEKIAINTYDAITLEGYIFADVDNTGATMMAYFGGNENGVGGNGYFFTPDRWGESRSAISCGNVTEPWNAEQGVTGPPVSVGAKHHVVSVLTDSLLRWYIDGVKIGETAISGNNSIANISTANAWLCKGGYTADPTWMGTIDEFNIYSGALDSATIAQHAGKYLTTFTLMHSYTFEDGTANDVVGTAHGTLEGDASVANGVLSLTGNGFVSLPGEVINIPSYSTITIEGVFNQAEGMTDKFTALASFGDINPAADWMGINYIILQPTRQDNENSRTSISCLNTTNPWATESAVDGPEIADTKTHHFVTVITESVIKLFIDGVLIGTSPLTGDNALANVGKSVALIGKDVYPGDPLWQGTVQELNIYQGEMDVDVIAKRAHDFITGISDLVNKEAAIMVYPTYSAGDFNVETSGNRGVISVYNLTGKLVLQRKIESSLEKVSLQKEGLYLMRIESEGVSKTFKVIKTK
ncbi:MAG: Cadherin-like beta sandwich domain protein [Bacteroidetes bacterium ADurb.Bin123]|nr:MAG: Cadherin-like beta sandwich domain protein [Bacteroidetes bacterium ADurb.Bin123]HQJ85745.1 cadherin-like beta sandwich domain-containing protein [Prolixibacteraceae bacterium]